MVLHDTVLLNGSILLNIHEVWPRPFWGGSSHQKKTLWIIPFASFEGDKRPDKINQRSREFDHLCPQQENNVSIFRVPSLIKIICLIAAD